ncbi:MAG: DNA cytosine methyltransferase [Gammaproteobacteria bacterium]|nr:DNA cytosine methyltransferase [Gammaproteobacteria bacterium]
MRVGSLFSGIGGFDLGFERAGMSIAWQSEIDPFACAVLKMRWVINSEAMREKAINAIRRLSLEVLMEIEVKPWKRKRTQEQNARLWMLYTAISNQAPAYMNGQWFSPDCWHYELAGRFLGYEATPSGKGKPKSTTELDVQGMSDYQAQIEAWAVEEFNLDLDYREAA